MSSPSPTGAVSLPSRIAFIGDDRQVHVIGSDGSGLRQVTWSKIPSALTRWGGSSGLDTCSWPGFSPDGRWIICFQAEGSDGLSQARICAVEVDGVEERTLAELTGQLPIYAQWNEQSEQIAVLVQDEDELQLWLCALDEVGHARLVDHGVPLFFSWAPGGGQVMLHAGDARRKAGRLVLRSLQAVGEDLVFQESPGSFCTPLFANGQLVFATHRGLQSSVCISEPSGENKRVLASMEGLLAVIPSPGGEEVAIGSSPNGEGSPYAGVWVVSAAGGDVEQVLNEECQAFFWVPGSRQLIFAQLDNNSRCFWWKKLDIESRGVTLISAFWPSRDQLFYLHFFEQYTHSHPLISADGTTLIFSGHAEPGTDSSPSPRLWTVDLRADSPSPVELIRGSFGTFPPRPL
jgi:dipeptidyl aminopeptidase/acylaminoacyl peptidase